jgi:predicted nucleic acid-binding protein
MIHGNRHQLDSSVVAELFEPKNSAFDEPRRAVRGYLLSKVGRNVVGRLSILALGEVVHSIRRRVTEWNERLQALRALEEFLESSKVAFNSPDAEAYRIASEILQNDRRAEAADALRVAEAIRAEAVLVTVDRILLESRYLRSRPDVKIIAPPGVPCSSRGESRE